MMRGRALGLLAVAAAAPLARNVILFVPDELRAESMSLFGGPAPTPNYERLAAGGTAFSQAFSTYPVCTQSRSAFLTGRFTSSAGHRSLWNPLRYYEPNLLAYAKASGRHVFWAGKNDAMDLASFNASVSEAGEWGAPPSGANAFRLDEPEYYSFISNATTVPLNGTHDAACVARAIDFLRARAPDAPPFFIYLPLISPHPPYGCPAPFYGFDGPIPPLRAPGLPGRPDFHERIRFYRNATKWADGTLERVQRLYLGCIQYSDFVLGTLLDAVDELGLAGETAIVATVRSTRTTPRPPAAPAATLTTPLPPPQADHGDYGGDYGLVEKWPSGLEDVLVRVPLIVSVPGGARGQRVAAPVQHFDLLPTLLDAMGVAVAHAHSAVSQLPVVLGAAAPDAARAVFAEGGYATSEPRSFEGDCSDPLRAFCDARNIYYPKGTQEWAEKLTVCRAAMVRTAAYKLIRRSDPLDADHGSELYDLAADPREERNVYADPAYAAVRANMSDRLLAWSLTIGGLNPAPYAESVLARFDNADEIARDMPKGNWTRAAAAPSRKRGLSSARPGHGLTFCADLAQAQSAISWTYSWALTPANTTCAALAALPFEPMVWGAASAKNLSSLFTTPRSSALLLFNEPNGAKQSDMTPAAAAALWPAVAAAARAHNLSIVAPVPSGADTAWLDAFFAACGGCAADIRAIALHPYACEAPALKAALNTWGKYDKPLWVTEFNCGNGARNASAAEHLAWMRVALPLLEADSRVERYAWMSARDEKVPGAALFSGAGGALTELGRFYLSAPA